MVGCEIWFCPLMIIPLLRTAPRVMRSSVEMTGMTALPWGMRATREKRKMAASRLWKKVLAPPKKKLPAVDPKPYTGDVNSDHDHNYNKSDRLQNYGIPFPKQALGIY